MISRKQWIRIISILSCVVVSMAAIALAKPPAPVLFLHGLSSDATAWERFSDILSLTDWTFGGCPLVNPSDDSVSTACNIPGSQGDYYRVQFSNNEGSILDQGEELKIIIDYVLSLNPKYEKVILVAHSMGGLAARSYLQFFSDNNVLRLITVGTPHQGSRIAEFCGIIPWCKPDSIALIDLDPDSTFLSQLNNLTVSPLPIEVEYTSIIGIDSSLPIAIENGDGVVSATSQNLSNIKETEFLNHLSIPIELECRTVTSVEAHRCEPDDEKVWVAILTQALASDRIENDPSVTQTIWIDDFEIYSQDVFPSPPWSNSGNSDAFVDNSTSVSGNQSLRLFGRLGSCWGAAAHTMIGTTAPFEIEFNIYTGSENLSGCHPNYGGVELSAGPSWTFNHRGLIKFTGTREIRGGAFEFDESEGIYLADFTPEGWYKVRIRYEVVEQIVRLSFWINDEFKGEHEFAARDFEHSFSHVGLWAGEGTAWYDDVKVIGQSNPTTFSWPIRPDDRSTVTQD